MSFLFLSTCFVFTFFSGLYLRGATHNIRRLIPLTIFEFVMLVAFEYSLYVFEVDAPDTYIQSKLLEPVVDRMLFLHSTSLRSVVSYITFSKLPNRKVWMLYLRLWRSSFCLILVGPCPPSSQVCYIQCNHWCGTWLLGWRTPFCKYQESDDDSLVPLLAVARHIHWPPSVVLDTIFGFQQD